MTPARVGIRSSRIGAYVLVLGSLLAILNVAIQPVSSQAFSTVTSTQTNTATYFTVSMATANISVTVLTVQYTTTTSIFTIQNVQFTTLTSFIARNQPPVQPAPSYHPSGFIEGTIIIQSIVLVAVILAAILFILKKR